MSRVLWDRASNPPRWLSGALGIEHWQLRGAWHKIKARSGLGGADRTIIYDDGKVTDANGEEIGNIYDEL